MSQTINPLLPTAQPAAPLARNPLLPQPAAGNPLIDAPGISAITPARPAAPRGVADRISTRVPFAKAAEATLRPHTRNDLNIGLAAAKESGDAFAKNADLVRSYPGINVARLRNPNSVSEHFINHVRDNLLFLHDKIPEEVRNRSASWYDGAHAIAHRWAQEYGYQPRAVAAALASLSPQKDWFQNVDLGRRILDVRRRQGNMSITPEMREWVNSYVDEIDDDKTKAKVKETLERIGSRPFAQLRDPYEQALWARMYDHGHNSRHYNLVTPEGNFGGPVLTTRGAPQRIGWGSFNEIAKAMAVLNDHSLENISKRMGENHKVRSFYNNIIAPNAQHGDATIDTHAVAAGLLRALAGKHLEVSHGLGLSGSSAAATGSQGLYGLYHEGYRRAAEARGILPRQMQSITWEGVRGLFSPEQKRDKAFVKAIDDIWDEYKRGRIDVGTARQRIHDHAGGIDHPEWHRPGA